MNYPLRFTHAAEIDYYESLIWYEERQAGLGTQFEEVIDRVVRRIGEQPEVFPQTRICVTGYTLRRVVIPRFPFVVFYTVAMDEVVVVAVFHTSRDPREIQQRTLS